MKNDGYLNVSHRIGSKDLGLGWLTGITEWRTPRAVQMRPHRHPHIELIFCMRGAMTYKVDGYGSVTIREGCGMVVPTNTDHVLAGGTDAPCERLGLHISRSISTKSRFSVFTPSDFAAFHATLSRMAARPFHLDTRLQSAIKELARLVRIEKISPTERGLVRALCCIILFYVADTLSKPLAAPQPQIMDEAVRFLESHYHEKLTSDALVLHMGYGRTQLFHLFKQHTGLSPNAYLVRFRIKKAKEMLMHTDKPVSAIAKTTGFSSVSYFNSVFLKYEGSSPSALLSKRKPARTRQNLSLIPQLIPTCTAGRKALRRSHRAHTP